MGLIKNASLDECAYFSLTYWVFVIHISGPDHTPFVYGIYTIYNMIYPICSNLSEKMNKISVKIEKNTDHGTEMNFSFFLMTLHLKEAILSAGDVYKLKVIRPRRDQR